MAISYATKMLFHLLIKHDKTLNMMKWILFCLCSLEEYTEYLQVLTLVVPIVLKYSHQYSQLFIMLIQAREVIYLLPIHLSVHMSICIKSWAKNTNRQADRETTIKNRQVVRHYQINYLQANVVSIALSTGERIQGDFSTQFKHAYHKKLRNIVHMSNLLAKKHAGRCQSYVHLVRASVHHQFVKGASM